MIDYSVDEPGIAIITWNHPEKAANVLNPASLDAYFEAANRAIDDENICGVIVTSAKEDFIAGGDLEYLLALDDAKAVFDRGMMVQAGFRRIETSGKPFLAAMNGAALGGGLELALACHGRIASDKARVKIGLPEVTFGLLPGGGGTQRLPRLIGIKNALAMMLDGHTLNAKRALELGIIDEVAPDEGLIEAARSWIEKKGPKRKIQAFDERGFVLPGGNVDVAMELGYFQPTNSRFHARTQGNIPAIKNILACVFHGCRLDIEAGLRVERRYFAATALTPQAKAMIRSRFFSMQNARKLARRPKGVPRREYSKIGILGAGMMGAGIAYACAHSGMEVILLDRDLGAAKAGKANAEALLQKGLARGKMSGTKMGETLARIIATKDYAKLAGCDMVIEAVFEDRAIKAEVTQKSEAIIPGNAIFATNTSSLPITGLAKASIRPGRFIGLHFFSPVHRMQLVEVIRGKQTSDETLGEALDFVMAIGKIPIIVNDFRAFYTSRVFRSFNAEGMALLGEGVNAAMIENASRKLGMPVGPLEVADAVSLELGYKLRKQTMADLGEDYVASRADEVIFTMVEKAGRLGRKAGAGFYDYPREGEKRLWAGLGDLFPRANEQPPFEDVQKRLGYIQSLETIRAMEEGVIEDAGDADIGSLLGWGFPAHRGGTIGQIEFVGIEKFVKDCDRLADCHGERFRPPRLLREKMASGESFYG